MEAVVNSSRSLVKIASVVDIYGLTVSATQHPNVLFSPRRIIKTSHTSAHPTGWSCNPSFSYWVLICIFLSILFMPHIILFFINFFVMFSLVKFIDFAIVYFIVKRVILLVYNILCIVCIICINLNEYIISILYRSILAYNLCQNLKERVLWSSNFTISVNFFTIF